MISMWDNCRRLAAGIALVALLFGASGCSDEAGQTQTGGEAPSVDDHAYGAAAEALGLPELEALDLQEGKLRVIATTSIIGDVVAQVGGKAIELTTLMDPGQDPHSYKPAARDLATVADADIIFVNGWDLEEALVHDLEEIGENAPLVAISAGIIPLKEDGQQGADPHVWLDPHHVMKWTENTRRVLSELDPDNAASYASNAAAFTAELEALDEYASAQLAQVPQEKRFLVTNHDSFAYFADAYDFTILGTVIPAASSLAEPSASDLADLVKVMEKHDLCTIFTESTLNDNLSRSVAGELDGCDEVKVISLYTGAIGPTGSDADSYILMHRANVDAIAEGLK